MADSTFTFRVDEELKAAFAEMAAAREHTGAQLLRLLMRDEVRRWHESREHDTWFRSEIEQALRDADMAARGVPSTDTTRFTDGRPPPADPRRRHRHRLSDRDG